MEKYKKIPNDVKQEDVIQWIEDELHRMYFHDPFLHRVWILANEVGFEKDDVYKIIAYNALLAKEDLMGKIIDWHRKQTNPTIIIPLAN